MENYDVVHNILGPIEPIGETTTDDLRYENLQETIKLINEFIDDIAFVSRCSTSQEYSVARAGKRAKAFLKGMCCQTKEVLNDET